MKRRSGKREQESIEQIFAEVQGHLVNAEELMLPSLEAKIRDVRQVCQKAYDALGGLQLRVERLSEKG